MALILEPADYFTHPEQDVAVFWRRHGIACVPHSHPYHEVILVLRGRAVHVVDEYIHEFGAGDVLLVRAGQTHHYRQVRGLEMAHVLLRQTRRQTAALEQCLCGKQEHDGYPGHLSLKAADFTQAVQRMRKLESNGEHAEREAAKLLEGIARCGRRRRARRIGRFAIKERRVSPVCRFLEEHFFEPVCLDDLAAVASMPRRTLLRLFQSVTGRSPFVYLHGLRLHHAMLQLRHTRKEVTEVALDVGFNDLSFFIRKFKALTGISPSAWRRQRVNEW